MNTEFNIFLRQAIREQQIPFPVSRNVPNTTTLAAMESAEKDEDVYGPLTFLFKKQKGHFYLNFPCKL